MCKAISNHLQYTCTRKKGNIKLNKINEHTTTDYELDEYVGLDYDKVFLNQHQN